MNLLDGDLGGKIPNSMGYIFPVPIALNCRVSFRNRQRVMIRDAVADAYTTANVNTKLFPGSYPAVPVTSTPLK